MTLVWRRERVPASALAAIAGTQPDLAIVDISLGAGRARDRSDPIESG